MKLVFCCQIFIDFHGFSPFFSVASTDSRSSDDYCITFCMLWVVDLECWLVTSRRPVQPPCVRQIWTCCHLVWLSHGIQMVLMVVADEGRRWPWHHGHSTVLICGSKTTYISCKEGRSVRAEETLLPPTFKSFGIFCNTRQYREVECNRLIIIYPCVIVHDYPVLRVI